MLTCGSGAAGALVMYWSIQGCQSGMAWFVGSLRIVSTLGCVDDRTDDIRLCTEGCEAGRASPLANDVVAFGWYEETLTENTTRGRRVTNAVMGGCHEGIGWEAGLARIVSTLG